MPKDCGNLEEMLDTHMHQPRFQTVEELFPELAAEYRSMHSGNSQRLSETPILESLLEEAERDAAQSNTCSVGPVILSVPFDSGNVYFPRGNGFHNSASSDGNQERKHTVPEGTSVTGRRHRDTITRQIWEYYLKGKTGMPRQFARPVPSQVWRFLTSPRTCDALLGDLE